VTPAPYAFPISCPFCGTATAASRCERCVRDPRAPRRVCAACARQTPIHEPVCMHCGAGKPNDMAWKVPVIILMFVVAFALAVALHR
jgi:predicted amidophosphoribosyltransferase